MPDLMWPDIARSIAEGGGYLVCATDGDGTRTAFEARTTGHRIRHRGTFDRPKLVRADSVETVWS